MEFTLLIYENIPENTNLYLIPNEMLTTQQLDLMKQANGKYANSDEENDDMAFLNAALCDTPEYLAEDAPDYALDLNRVGVFVQYLVGERGVENPIEGVNITRVFMSGFVL